MKNQEDVEKEQRAVQRSLKLQSYIAIAWGAIVLFALMGILMGKEDANVFSGLIVWAWVFSKIVANAADGFMVLNVLKKNVTTSKKD